MQALATAQGTAKQTAASRGAGESTPPIAKRDRVLTKSEPVSSPGLSDERGNRLALAVAAVADVAARRDAVAIAAVVVAQSMPAAGPLVTQVLAEVLPFDMAQIELAMQQFLADVDSLLPESPTSATVLRWTPPLALGVTVGLTGIMLVWAGWLVARGTGLRT